jgi:gluconolactonase
MRVHWVSGLVIAGIAVALAQTQTGSSGSVERLDSGLDAIVPVKATIERVAGGFKWPEGPVWVRSGFLLFSEIPSALIDKWTPDGKVTTYLGPKEFTMKDLAAAGVPGSNGLTLDKQGRLTICDQGNRRITRLEKDGHFTVLADRYQGKRFNSPNDLVYKSDGSLYFTDPPYGLEKQDNDPKKELPFNGVFRIAGGKVNVLVRDLTRPNGIAFSPNEDYLYVDNSGKIFYDLASTPGKNAPDGMKVDRKGNVYATGPGGIWIFSPEGKHLGTVKLPEIASNCAWGDADGKTLYITASTGLYRIHLKIPGIRP